MRIKLIALAVGLFLIFDLIFFLGRGKSKEQYCTEGGGDWLGNFKECEGIGKEACERAGGNYKNCESACRHDNSAGACIEICVEVCEF